ncbi:peptidoglycan/LPS O-acetylase OafA/YrhL [Sphingomonas kyeonggiensis]|uniref:acyltransferase family protein n=1 Tax=Sphingomonas kyeonggiensis TaxID=1268553 RepID=UPI002780F97A|nr:acyltransferase family protein [Sphingomonas kyeonggiensis]MDQ0249837.1 peptidoglycan/LPS O-acetylase OafA/YrhL [Sphingomonas kyeonggiensis]
MTTDQVQAPERLHALDAVRAGALLLGVAFHASLSFLPGPQIWVVRDVESGGVLDFFFVAHIFRMAAFFLIAGFFGRMLLERRGTGGFVRNRLARIGLPLLAFWPIAMFGIVATFIWGAVVMNGGTPPTNQAPPPPMTAQTFPLTHLWFLYLLLLFYAGALALRALGRLVDRDGGLADGAMRLLTATPFAAVALAAPLAIALSMQPLWFPWGGIPTPDKGFLPNSAALIGFGTAFAFGWLLHRQQDLLGDIRRWFPVHLVAALALTGACLWQLGAISFVVPIAEGGAKTALACTYALAVWSWTLGLTGAALRFLTRERPAIRYVADASYWIYLVHLPVVMALQVLVYPVQAPAFMKLALVTGGAFLILLASYHLLVRHSWIGKWLNGRKLPRRAARSGMEMQAA